MGCSTVQGMVQCAVCCILGAKHCVALGKANVPFAVQHWKGNALWIIGEELQSAVLHWGGGGSRPWWAVSGGESPPCSPDRSPGTNKIQTFSTVRHRLTLHYANILEYIFLSNDITREKGYISKVYFVIVNLNISTENNGLRVNFVKIKQMHGKGG